MRRQVKRAEHKAGAVRPEGVAPISAGVCVAVDVPADVAEIIRQFGNGQVAEGLRMLIEGGLDVTLPRPVVAVADSQTQARFLASPVASLMKEWRLGAGLSQKAAAAMLPTSSDSWARWERGDVWPDAGWRARIKALAAGKVTAPKEGRTVSAVPAALLEYRDVHAMSQEESARNFGCSRRTWQAWEAGENKPGKVMLGKIWRFLDREMREFR